MRPVAEVPVDDLGLRQPVGEEASGHPEIGQLRVQGEQGSLAIVGQRLRTIARLHLERDIADLLLKVGGKAKDVDALLLV